MRHRFYKQWYQRRVRGIKFKKHNDQTTPTVTPTTNMSGSGPASVVVSPHPDPHTGPEDDKADKAKQNKLLLDKCAFLNPHPDSFYKISVSGKHYTIAKNVLCSEPESVLAYMFSGKYELKMDKEWRVTLSVDPQVFDLLLGWLYDKVIPYDLSRTMQRKLLQQAKMFNLTKLVTELKNTLQYNTIQYGDFLKIYDNKKKSGDPLVFSCVNLTGCSFDGLDFHNGRFLRSNISFTSFIACEFKSCNFSGSNIVAADFTNSRFHNSNFLNSDLSNSDFTSTKLENTFFADCDLTKAKFPKIYSKESAYIFRNAKGLETVSWV
eukprot:TRINITY_DN3132_c0_g1_i1.p1 TRINITY_DN3132_c0_g1~~TRINITY_DN3132_c0_g1_i1.p1  ORF type:complete len:321 (-),score=41.05 TRINITY_DN3132_c0_g1_i1:66-1028(-)